jgi:hypothetical protein
MEATPICNIACAGKPFSMVSKIALGEIGVAMFSMKRLPVSGV